MSSGVVSRDRHTVEDGLGTELAYDRASIARNPGGSTEHQLYEAVMPVHLLSFGAYLI